MPTTIPTIAPVDIFLLPPVLLRPSSGGLLPPASDTLEEVADILPGGNR